MASVVARYADGVEGGGTWAERPAELAGINQRSIEALDGVGMDELGAMIERDLATLVARVRSYGDPPPSFRFHGGEQVRADTGLGILLGELLVHGWDIARTTGRPWPIDPADVELVVEGVERILPGWVDPERARRLTATYALRLRGQGTHVWSFRDGRLQVDADGRRPDVTISAQPVALLLVLYKRRPQWPAIARGRLLAWGRRPGSPSRWPAASTSPDAEPGYIRSGASTPIRARVLASTWRVASTSHQRALERAWSSVRTRHSP